MEAGNVSNDNEKEDDSMKYFYYAFLLFPFFLSGGSMSEETKDFSISTSDTFLSVKVHDKAPIIMALKPNVKDGWNWAREVPIPLIDHVLVNGNRTPVTWRLKGAQKQDSPHESTVKLTYFCTKPDMELVLFWRAKHGPGPIRNSITILNKSTQELIIPLQRSITLALQGEKDHALESLWVEKGAGTPSDTGTHHEKITKGYSFHGQSSPYPEEKREMIPWLCVQDVNGNHGLYLGVEFSGRVAISLTAGANTKTLELSAGIDPTGVEFQSIIPPGGSWDGAPTFAGCYKGDVDKGVNNLHRFIEKWLRPPVSDQRYPLIVNNSWGSGMAVDDSLCREMIDESAELGVEMFHVDAGWFKSVGDWHCHPQKFPGGLAPIADYARSKGLLFGLWVGWTQGGNANKGVEALSVNNPDMREWFGHDYPADWTPWEFTGADVCLASSRARDWCLKELIRMVEEFKIDLLEHDQRMIIESCDRLTHGHTSHPADISYHAAKGYNFVYDQLRRRFPKLLFEDCVNGGRMVDFGVVQRVHYVCYTDTYDPLSNRRGFYDASYPLPPSMLEAYVADHPGKNIGTFKAMLRSGMMGWLTIMCDTSAWSSEQHQAAKRQLEVYKSWIRPLICRGDIYHISERPDGIRWDGMQYFDAKTKRGVVFAFRGTTSDPQHSFKLKGLKSGATYKLWCEDNSSPMTLYTGAQLAEEGVMVTLSEPDTSELIYIQES